MKQEAKTRRILRGINHWLVFFLVAAFFITCCMLLFVSTLSKSLGIQFTEEHLNTAAKLTFVNVLFLSLIFTLADIIRRYFFVNRPVKKIVDAAEKMMQGDFSVRIEPIRGISEQDSFNRVIDCFNNMAAELSGTETLRTDFIANVSHELKTPLAVMQNYGTMLQRPDLREEERMEYAKAVSDTSQRLALLITNILKLNKLENQQVYPAAERYDLSEQLCECLLQFENVWEKKAIDLKTDIAEGVEVCADGELLSLVWNNLLSNAFKFTEKGGCVGLRLTAEEDYVTVRISDTGCGMTPEVGAHIFEKFYQGDTSHATAGNGLGLALVKRVVDIMHGEIRVESELGKGSTFTVKFRRQTNGKVESLS